MGSDSNLGAASGLAALSICESLIVCLVEKGLLDAMEFDAILEDARSAHENSTPQNYSREDHKLAAALISRIMAKSNSVRGASFL